MVTENMTAELRKLQKWKQGHALTDAYRKRGYQFVYNERTKRGYLTVPGHPCADRSDACELTLTLSDMLPAFYDIDGMIEKYRSAYVARYSERIPSMLSYLPQ